MKYVAWVIALAFLTFALLQPAAAVLTDSWWYANVGYSGVFYTTLWARLLTGAAEAAIVLAITGVNLLIAWRYRPFDGHWVAPNVFELNRSNQFAAPGKRLAVVFCAVLTLMAGMDGAANWQTWLFFRSGGSFGRTDPVFGLDYGFYVFRLPFFTHVTGVILTSLVLSMFLVVGMSLALRSVSIQHNHVTTAPAVRRHAFTLAGITLAVYAVSIHLSTYALVLHNGHLLFGASYTDLHATLPLLHLMTVLCALSALAFVINGLARGWKASAVTFGVLVATGTLGMGIYPALVQRLMVAPNEFDREKPYIKANIEATRFAYGINHVQERDFAADNDLKWSTIVKNRQIVDNVRLWDREPLLFTYRQMQEIRTYYDFYDADNDRYYIDGRLQQISLSPRELGYQHLPSRNWINEHLSYTHGFGLCAGPVARVSSNGLPEFYVKNLPPESSVPQLAVTQPRIYYGEESNSYVLVRTRSREFDYPNGDENVYTSYSGKAVAVGTLLTRLAFALRFGEPKILLSTDILPSSGILYHRQVLKRAQLVTPLIHYEPDPYMVVSNGRLYWMLDGYTTTDAIPYSQPTSTSEDGASLNYMRNSVKTVVDAYTGAVTAYVSDPRDPVVRACAGIYPGVFHPLNEMPPGLRAHVRYPQAMFAIQSDILSIYHMEDPQVFYNREDVWKVPNGDGGNEFHPYYTVCRFPNAKPGTREEFVLMTLFTPSKRQNMIAWMAARCDGSHYGQLVLYKLPKQKLIYGPAQIDARVQQDPDISRQVTLWNQQGSKVRWGTQLVIPMENSLIYVKPLYLESTRTQGGLPQLQRVVVAYGDRVAMRPTLDESLAAVFHETPTALMTTATGAQGTAGGSTSATPPGEPSAASQSAPQASAPLAGSAANASSPPSREGYTALTAQAWKQLQLAKKYQREGNWAGYGAQLQKLEATLRVMKTLQTRGSSR